MKKVFKFIISGLIIFTLGKIYYDLKYFDITLGILSIEFGDQNIALISKKSLMFVSKYDKDNEFILNKMDELGWKFIDMYGRGLLFVKGAEEIVLFKKDYFGIYTSYEIEASNDIKDAFLLNS